MEESENRREAEASSPGGEEGARTDGIIHISEDVIVELARKTIQGVPNIQTVSRFGTKFGIGRKGNDGIRISIGDDSADGSTPTISVDAYVLVKYGKRIPDLAWEVQERVKANLERYTGYIVKAVNINVQGIYMEEPIPEPPLEASAEAEPAAVEEAGESFSGAPEAVPQ